MSMSGACARLSAALDVTRWSRPCVARAIASGTTPKQFATDSATDPPSPWLLYRWSSPGNRSPVCSSRACARASACSVDAMSSPSRLR